MPANRNRFPRVLHATGRAIVGGVTGLILGILFASIFVIPSAGAAPSRPPILADGVLIGATIVGMILGIRWGNAEFQGKAEAVLKAVCGVC